jgi:hypothetical protein
MRPTEFSADPIIQLLRKQQIATLPQLMSAVGTDARRTVFRKLVQLSYRTSYTHRGAYYTIDEQAQFDDWGLWTCREVWFSVRGTLLATAAALVDTGPEGYFVGELDNLLHVSTEDALRKLVLQARLSREKLAGQFLYCAAQTRQRDQQLRARRLRIAEPGVVGPLPEKLLMPDELRAAIVLFFSLLDEQQRRLYAGLEALKTGRGGDGRIAELLGVNVGTVARGRRELLAQDVQTDRVRRAGGGRQRLEKKLRKSLPASKH